MTFWRATTYPVLVPLNIIQFSAACSDSVLPPVGLGVLYLYRYALEAFEYEFPVISACREYVQTISKTPNTLTYRASELRFASCNTRTRACGVEIGEWVLFLKTRKVLVCELGTCL